MARLLTTPVKYREGISINEEEIDFVVTDSFLQGMVTDADPARLPNEALVMAKNTQFSRGQLFRRNGLTSHSTKPNSNQITKLVTVEDQTNGVTFLRFTATTIYKYTSTGWVAILPSAIPAIGGSVYDDQRLTMADDRCFFANGFDPIREIIISTSIYQALGNAENYKYITAAFNRIVGANLIGAPNVPIQVGWCGDLNYSEWDPLVDRTAGYSPIIGSPSDTSDDITGIFTEGNSLVIPRQRSIWIGTNQAIATNPFKFYSALPGVGADCPRAIHVTPHGLVWFSFQRSSLYVWPYTGEQIELSQQVSKHIKNNTYSPEFTWGTYNINNNEYSIFAANPINNLVKSWTYSFEYKNWTYEEYLNFSDVGDIAISGAAPTIDALTGTIDALFSTIDSLGGIIGGGSRVYGTVDGEILVQSDFDGFSEQIPDIVLTDNGTPFTTEIDSKIYEILTNDLFLNSHGVSIIPYTTGSVSLYFSKDDGNTWTLSKTITFDADDLEKAQSLVRKKAIKAKRFQWRITTTNCMFALSGAAIRATKAGETK